MGLLWKSMTEIRRRMKRRTTTTTLTTMTARTVVFPTCQLPNPKVQLAFLSYVKNWQTTTTTTMTVRSAEAQHDDENSSYLLLMFALLYLDFDLSTVHYTLHSTDSLHVHIIPELRSIFQECVLNALKYNDRHEQTNHQPI